MVNRGLGFSCERIRELIKSELNLLKTDLDSLIKRVRLKDNERKCLNGSGSQANTPGNVETKNILQSNPNSNVSDSRENASRDHPQRESRPSSRTHISKFSIAGLKDELNQGVEAGFKIMWHI